MQIGTLLAQQPGAPCVLREVLVQLVHQVDGVEHTAEVKAVLAPVTEPKYEEARRFAEDWLLRKDPTSPYREVARDELGKPTEERVPLSLPHEVLERERDRTFLLFALRGLVFLLLAQFLLELDIRDRRLGRFRLRRRRWRFQMPQVPP